MKDPGKWINIYPLMNPDGWENEIKSYWVNSEEIKSMAFKEKEGKWTITVYGSGNEVTQSFEKKYMALKIWQRLKDALGVTRNYKRGPRQRYYEKLED